MGTTAPSRWRRVRGPWVLLAGFLLASLGGLTDSDCILCTLSELVPVGIGGVVVLVGAAMTQVRRDGSVLARAVAGLLIAGAVLAVAVSVRVVLPGLLWESPHAEATQP